MIIAFYNRLCQNAKDARTLNAWNKSFWINQSLDA